MADDLTAFLTARLDEDETTAKDTLRALAWMIDNNVQPPIAASTAGEKVTRMGRLLREVEAKRAILAEHAALGEGYCPRCSQDEEQPLPVGWWVPAPCPTMRALAGIWSDHPDYHQEWAPAPTTICP
jgi:hypothetical protein